MTLITLLILALPLSVDTFAVTLTKGATAKRLKTRQKHRVAIIFAACAMAAPVLGWAVGSLVSGWVTTFDHWIAFTLLAAVGAHMAHNGLTTQPESPRTNPLNPTRIIVTAVATNIDAVAVGIGLAFIDVNIWAVSATVGLATVVAVYAGLHFGKRTGKWLGSRAEVVGGAVLIALGTKILLQHLLA